MSGSAWYAAYPIPTFPPSPIPLYTFRDKELERMVYTHSSAGIQQNSWFQTTPTDTIRKDNDVLEWLGDGLLKGLTGVLLVSLFPDLREGPLSDIRSALESNKFYAHLTRQLGLQNNLVAHSCEASTSDRVLGSLFEAYIGGVYQDLGNHKWAELYAWFATLLEPYAHAYRDLWESRNYTESQTTGAPGTIQLPMPMNAQLPPSTVIAPTALAAYAPPIMMNGMFPQNPTYPTLHMKAGSTTSTTSADAPKTRRQTVSIYTSRLMEYAAKNRLTQPVFSFKDNGFHGTLIEWTASVKLDGRTIASAIATTKAEAKHLASREALIALRAPMGSVGRMPPRKRTTRAKAAAVQAQNNVTMGGTNPMNIGSMNIG